jgi:hypothetical protein
MTFDDKVMKKLLDRVAEDMGDGVTAKRLFVQRTAFAASIGNRHSSFKSFVLAAAAAAVLLIAMGAAFFILPKTDNEFEFSVGNEDIKGEPGLLVHTAAKENSALAFKQGSRFVLKASSDARVASADRDKVSIELLRGVIEADVVGNGTTKWEVTAGPYRVSVLGTRFTVNFNETTRSIDVEVTRGRVLVEGPNTSDGGVEILKGDRLHVESNSSRPVEKKIAADENKAPSNPPDVAPSSPVPLQDRPKSESAIASKTDIRMSESGDQKPPRVFPSPLQKENSKDPPSTDGLIDEPDTTDRPQDVKPAQSQNPLLKWLAYYEHEEFTQAIEKALEFGIDDLIAALDSENLWKLQDAARISGRHDISFKILTEYRNRFPKNKNAKTASFLLGKIALDDKGLLKLAASWFETYLQEDPNGPLAEEAQGRLIMVNEKMGRTTEAREAARRYLDRYENGAFDQVAERVLDAK